MAFISYAQNFEDVMLWRVFKDIHAGFYIDAGAGHPDTDSVTRAFYDRGWRGINIEPSTEYFNRLASVRYRDINLNIALGDTTGTLPFFQVEGTGLSTVDPVQAKNYRADGRKLNEHSISCVTLADVCQAHAEPHIHFLKIDVEGSEEGVLAGADFDMFRPWVVLVEATHPMSQEPSYKSWEPILIRARYQFVYFDGLNRFYVAQEHHERLAPTLSVPPNVFDDFLRANDTEVVHKTTVMLQKAQLQAAEQIAVERAQNAALLAQERLDAIQRATDSRLEADDATMRLRSDLQRMQNHEHTQTARANNLQQKVDHLNARLDAMFASTSWRVTAPLRALKQRTSARQPSARGPMSPTPILLPQPIAADQPVGAAPEARTDHPAQEVEQLVQYIQAVHASTSWRLTRPIRLAKSAPLRLLGRTQWRDGEPDLRSLFSLSGPGSARHVTAAPLTTQAQILPQHPIRVVHQFHSGSAVGDAITNGMLLIRKLLKNLGFRSEIFVEHRDPAMADCLLLLDDLPVTPDVILIIHHSMGHDAMDRILALPARKILLYHNITPPELLNDSPWAIPYARLGRSQLHQLRPHILAALADSEYNAQELRGAGYTAPMACPFLIDVDKTAANASDHAEEDDTNPFTIIFVGRMVASKGQVDLVDAFALFKTMWNRPCRLLLVGHLGAPDAPYVQEVTQLIRHHALQDHVMITGPVADADLHDLYRQAHLYVSLSLHEGLGLPLVEAMAHRLPIIAWPAGAVPYTLGHEINNEAMLLADRSPATAASAMLSVAKDLPLAKAMVARQLKVLERFRLHHHAPRLLQALTIAGARPPELPTTRQAIQANMRMAVTGHTYGSYSLAVVNRSMTLALESHAPSKVRLITTEVSPQGDSVPDEIAMIAALAAKPKPPTGPEVVISQNYPVLVPEPPVDLAIAFLFWEESLMPEATIATLANGFGKVLAPANFVAKVLIDSGLPLPVETVGYAPRLSRFFDLATERSSRPCPDHVTFLHVSSCFPRKGIDVLLMAYAQAFHKGDAVRLVIKGFPNPHNDVPEQIEKLRQNNPDAPEIVLINQDLDDAAMLDLFRQADAMVLPTRGEGFNIPAAEAMAAGLPLIVTGFGGHLDFCTDQDARLLKFHFAPSQSHLATPSSVWVEPDVSDLAAALRELFIDVTSGTGAAAAKAAVATQTVRTKLDSDGWAARVTESATDALLAPQMPPLRVAWVSSWDVACGIAEYSRFLVTAIINQIDTRMEPPIVLADERTAASSPRAPLRVFPAWQAGVPESMPRLARAIANQDPDVVVIQHQPGFIHWHALADLLADQRLLNRITIVTLHAAQRLLDISPQERTKALAALANASRVMVHRIADLEMLRGYGLIANVTLFPQGAPRQGSNALRPTRTLSPASDPVVGCYGFFLPGKGIPRLIEAVAVLRRTWPKLRLRLVNAEYPADVSTQEIASCRRLAASLDLEDAIEWFTDFTENEVSLSHLSTCDLLVMPYDPSRESSSAALRGAMVSGVPIAVTPIALFDEAGDAVHRVAGLDVASLADGINNLLHDQPARTRLKSAAARWLADNDWDLLGRRMMGMLLGLRASCRTDYQIALTTQRQERRSCST